VCAWGRGKYTQKKKKKHPKINTQHEARLTRKYKEKKNIKTKNNTKKTQD
jgi:hypothetical protein